MTTEQTEEQWERLRETARKLIDAPASAITEDPENFLEMVRITTAALEQTKPRVGRGGLLVELGLKCADIRDHPERCKNLSGSTERRAENGNRPEANPSMGADTHGQPKGSETRRCRTSDPARSKDSNVGGMLCPECAGLEVHNDNCSQKIASAETDSDQPTVPGEAVQSGALTAGRRDPHAPAISTEVVDNDDAPW